MPGPSRTTKSGGPSDRRAGAQRQRRTRRPAPKQLARRVSWSRRIGIAAALVLLVGGAVAFAGQAFDNGPGRRPPASAPPPPALTLLAPAEPVTRRASAELIAVRPQNLRADQAYRVRVYVNGAQVIERELPASESFALPDIPLVQGPNLIGATLVGDGGESQRSSEVTILRDDEQPEIRITQPAGRATAYSDTVLLRGRTEPGASLSITRAGSGSEIESTVGDDGRFSATLDLNVGSNAFVIRSADVAGNQATERMNVTRAESAARLTLSIQPELIEAAALPATVILTATVRDEVGDLVDGAEVTFGVSPPTSSTTTYRLTTVNGRARWSNLTLTPGDAAGTWLVTVSATLPSGVELRQDGSFSLE